ncbi:hypothetical protein PINS_up002708 [Pythium insidiosum]|nr:hypothetical protein PINS_up002708 [Pythium insidiosum]
MARDPDTRQPTAQRAAWAPDTREDHDRLRHGHGSPLLSQSTVVQTLPPDFQREASKQTLRSIDRVKKSTQLARASTYRLPGKAMGCVDEDETEQENHQQTPLDKRSTLHKAATSATLSPASSPIERRKTASTIREQIMVEKKVDAAAKEKPEETATPVESPSMHRPRQRRSSVFDEMVDSEDVATLCVQLGLSKRDVWQLRRAFNSEDPDGTNSITLASFFFLIHEEKRALTKSLLQLASSSPSRNATRLSFDEFLRIVVTFASFSEQQVLAFFFEVYSVAAAAAKNQNAKTTMTDSELESLANDLQVLQTAFARNVQVATAKSTAKMAFADFERLARQHSVAFLFPLLQIQRHVRQTAGLGEAFWRAKTREREALERLLVFMESHHGALPPLSLREWLSGALWWGQRATATTRRRALARRIYAARQSQRLLDTH